MSAVIEIERTHVTASGARYRVWHDGVVLVESAREPLCSGARALVEKGVTGRVQMRRLGTGQVDMEGLIAVLAAKTVLVVQRRLEDIPTGTVKSRINRGREMFHRVLGDQVTA